ncbi:MAG TPA: efflux RND transporter periplasmic adaptor subunit [Luteimonas sp.]|nr:efflux RND transporter periplasmic adaptor subunit [Luteimonas sp.]
MRATWFPVLAMSALLAACGKQEAPPAPPPPEVGVLAVKPANVPLQKDLVGRLAAYRSADVRARVPGVLQRRAYAEGSDVRKGQLLFVIDPAPLRAALSQAQASLAQAQASYTNAKVAADRARQLAPTNFISKSDLDNAQAAERSAAAAVQAGKASVDSARINLGYASVSSPIDGRAGKQQVTEGALVGQGDATLLTTVDQIDPLYVNFSLSVAELEQVRAAQGGQTRGKAQVQVLLPDGTPYSRMGELDFSGDIVDPATGAIALRALLPNPDKTLLPGTYVTLKATLGEQQNVFLVPQAAVQRDAASAYVLVVGQDGKVVRKDIATDRSQGNQWVVRQGLNAGDQVIVSGLQKAQPGQPAKATPWQPNNGQGAAPANGAKKEDKPAAKG